MGLIAMVGTHVDMEVPADRVFPKVQGHAGQRQHRLLHGPVRSERQSRAVAAGLLTSWFPFEVVTLSCCSRAGLRGLSKLLAWLALTSGWEGMASASGFGVWGDCVFF